jgi:pimeloyl-ACP methyl ester carboxylesterase
MKMIVHGLAAEYADEGSGQVLLMLHGWKDSLHTFDALAPYLVRRFRVVRIDMPGFGASELPPSSWALDDYVDFVAACIDKLGLDVAVLLGHSFGGRVAIKGISRGVFKPHKLVLIASAGVAERKIGRNKRLQLAAKIGKLLTAPLPERLRTAIRRRLYRTIGSDYLSTGSLRDIFIRVVAENLAEHASRITMPTLLVWGSADASTPLSEGEKLAQLIRGSQLEIFEGASHFVHQENAQEIATLIDHFI